ncbi:MAG: hypothetical protein M1499_00930 [Firmicutes bacterium]|nr:hypothetical protein [Bacillota bacterium]
MKGDRIIAIGPTAELTKQYSAPTVRSLPVRLIIPGLVDGHIHSSFQPICGLADEVGSQKFLVRKLVPRRRGVETTRTQGLVYAKYDHLFRCVPKPWGIPGPEDPCSDPATSRVNALADAGGERYRITEPLQIRNGFPFHGFLVALDKVLSA